MILRLSRPAALHLFLCELPSFRENNKRLAVATERKRIRYQGQLPNVLRRNLISPLTFTNRDLQDLLGNRFCEQDEICFTFFDPRTSRFQFSTCGVSKQVIVKCRLELLQSQGNGNGAALMIIPAKKP